MKRMSPRLLLNKYNDVFVCLLASYLFACWNVDGLLDESNIIFSVYIYLVQTRKRQYFNYFEI